MPVYFIAHVEVLTDGNILELVTVTGKGFNLDNVKQRAEDFVRQDNPDKKITSIFRPPVLDVTADEYEKIMGERPSFGDACMGRK